MGGARGRILCRLSPDGSRILEKSFLKRTKLGGRGRVAADMAAVSRGRGLRIEAEAAAAHSGEQGVVMTWAATLKFCDDSLLDDACADE